MRHKIIIILIFILISSILTGLTGEEIKGNGRMCGEPDTFTPASATLFVKVAKISKAVDFLNTEKEYFNAGNVVLNYGKWIILLKDKAKIDVLNAKSLKEIGIDVNGGLYIADIVSEKNIAESVFFIPVTDKKNFPFAVVQFLKKIAGNDKTSLDLNPAISSYKGVRVFQIPGKIFFAVIDDYFVLAPSGDSLSEIIDLKLKGCDSSLAADPLYKDYKSKAAVNNESNIINIYLKKEFLDRAYKAVEEKSAIKNKKIYNKDSQEAAGNRIGNDSAKDNSTNTNNINEKGQIPQKSKFNFVSYIALCMGGQGNEVSLTGILSANKEDPFGNLLMKAATTGMFEKAIAADNPTGYHFISIDIDKLNSYCTQLTDKDDSIYKAYAKILKFTRGKDILKDAALPCSKSFVNIIFRKPKNIGEMDDFIVYIPMKECGEIAAPLKKIKNELKKIYTAEGAFGEEKINGTNSFWFKQENNAKINVLEFEGDLYAGSDIEAIRTVLNSSYKNPLDIQKDFIKGSDKNTFLLSFTQFDDESFLKAILLMLAFNKNPGLSGFISKMDSLNLTGKKIDNEFILNLRIKMLPGNK